MNSKLVIYHAHCWDGFCAAWLMHLAFDNASYVPAQYGDAPPDCKDQDVYILDFSYPLATLLDIAAAATSVTILDHHKTAEETVRGFADVCMAETGKRSIAVFDMEKSGAHLTLDYLQSLAYLQPEVWPWLMRYTEDRDLWRWKLPQSREINAALHSYPLHFTIWDDLAREDPHDRLLGEGRAIVRRDKQIVAEHVARARRMVIAGHEVPVVNATTMFSDIAGELAKGEPFAACYFDREDGKRQYSLRSDANGLDVAEIAKHYGGGGHAHAAGYTRPGSA